MSKAEDIYEERPQGMSVRHAAVWSVGGQYIGFALQFVSSVVISRFFLAPAEVGLFSIALAAAMLISLLQDFGLTRFVVNMLEVTRDDIRRCSSVALVFALTIGVVIAIAAVPMARAYGHRELAPILLIIAGSYIFVPYAIVPMALMSRDMAFRGLFAINTSSALAQAAIAIGLAWLGFSSSSLAWAMVGAALVKAVVAQSLRPALPFPLRFDGIRPVLNFGSKSSTLFVIGAAGSRSADLVIGGMLSLTATGLFSRANGLTQQLRMLISGAAGAVLYPAMARLQREGEDLAEPYLRVVACFTAANWPAMLGLAIASGPTVNFLFGPAWAGTAPILSLIAISELLFVALPFHVEMGILRGRMHRLIGYNILDTGASLLLLFIGAGISLHFAAISRIAYSIVWLAIYMRFVCGLAGIHPRQLLPIYLSSAVATLAAIAPLGIVALLVQDFATINFAWLVILAASGVALWLIVLMLLDHPLYREIRGMAEDATARMRALHARAAG